MTEDTFDRIAHEYDEAFPPHIVEHYLAKRVRYISQHCPRGRVLDVGCGTGTLAGRLAAAGFGVTGIDPSQGMLDVMADTVPLVGRVRGEGSDLPFADETFDVAITVAALHHVADPADVRTTLMEMVRVLRPSGRIVVWDHNPRNPYWKNLMARVPQDDGSERLVPEEEIVGGLEAGGGEVIGTSQLGLVPEFVPPSLIGVARVAEKVVERTPGLRRLCAHNVILARRR
jgi:SAM-dependent methyltransferase